MSLQNEPTMGPSTQKEVRRQWEKRFRTLIEHSSDIMSFLNMEGYITYISPSITHITGYAPQALVGSHAFAPVHPEDQAQMQQVFANILLTPGKTLRAEYRFLCQDGTYRWFETAMTNLLHKPAVAAIVSNFHDITERKEAEQEREQLLQEFISLAGHELKTPVTSLKGYAQLLYRRFKKHGDEEALRFLGRMNNQLDKLTGLINDLLDISRLQTGRLEYRKEPFDLDILAREVVENVQDAAQKQQVVLENPDRARVHCDRERIAQVLGNLLTNAIKYSPADATIVVRIRNDGKNALLSVQDSGPGIEQDQQPKIFERFYQIHDKDHLPSGLGVGLYIAREIIKRHHGRIWVESERGKGSTFSFSLPLHPYQAAS